MRYFEDRLDEILLVTEEEIDGARVIIFNKRSPAQLHCTDKASSLVGIGESNCIVCRHFVPHKPCPAWLNQSRSFMLDQEGVALWNNGACPLAEHLPKLTAELLREIVGHVLDGNTVIYQDGIIKVMQPR